MRKISLIVFLSLSFLFVVAQDQGTVAQDYKNIIKISPINFFSNTFLLSYERLIGTDKSLNISTGIIYKDSDYRYVGGYRGELQFRYFVLQRETIKAKRKLYFAPFAFGQYTDITERNYYDGTGTPHNYSYKVNAFGAGIVMGINWTFARRFVVDAFVGGGVRNSNIDSTINSYVDDGLMGYGYKGIFPRVGLDLGFTF